MTHEDLRNDVDKVGRVAASIKQVVRLNSNAMAQRQIQASVICNSSKC